MWPEQPPGCREKKTSINRPPSQPPRPKPSRDTPRLASFAYLDHNSHVRLKLYSADSATRGGPRFNPPA